MASKIREVFLGEKGLNGAIKKLPVEGVFELKNVKQVRGKLEPIVCAGICKRYYRSLKDTDAK